MVSDGNVNKTVVIIPARGGSKEIPNKNIKDFFGKPLIAWAIIHARSSKKVSRVIVSTDNKKIAEIARMYGAEVPFMRPIEISTANTPIEPVLSHAWQWLCDNENYVADALVLLFPTSPLRLLEHIEDSIELFYRSMADSVITVNESPAHYTPYWTIIRNDSGKVTYFNGSDIRLGYTRRQDFPVTCYAKNDLVFVLKPSNLFEHIPSLFGERPQLLITDKFYDCDINDISDWNIALQKFKYIHENNKNLPD